ncbi:hypothetical protein [Natranaerobius trueperi]|uniref:Uncharacterized protein n=1 Tax=Natranaerobius trueperi TaxID=759412 RepID=A0A226BV64_9FIRM|nr:hypothetical protein [Natranaerobius trueperi]OWZ82771.1 hypothetical protein CDO51_12370 [Natranaerobius trueperi]
MKLKKTLLSILITFILAFLIIGCGEVVMENNENKAEPENTNDKIKVNDEYLEITYKILSEEVELEEYQRVSIQELENNFMLVELQLKEAHYADQGPLFLVDIKEREMKRLIKDGHPYTANILELDNDILKIKIRKHNGSQNLYFPKLVEVNLETGNVETKDYYLSLHGDHINIGSGTNGLELGEVDVSNDTLTFSFLETEESVLAGGLITPSIKLGSYSEVREKYNNDNVMTIELGDTYGSDNFDVSDLEKHPKIKQVHYTEYEDGFDANHVVLVLEFIEDIKYTGNIPEDMKFELTIK